MRAAHAVACRASPPPALHSSHLPLTPPRAPPTLTRQVPPLAPLLFCGAALAAQPSPEGGTRLTLDGWMQVDVSERAAALVLEVRVRVRFRFRFRVRVRVRVRAALEARLVPLAMALTLAMALAFKG